MEVVVYHSAYGVRPAILGFAAQLRAAGHVVHTPDLYDGEVFNDREDVLNKLQALGFDALLERALSRIAHLPREIVFVGFSNGGACAELAAATRPGARGAVLIHAPLMLRDLGWKTWPPGAPVQSHFATRDPIRAQPAIDSLADRVRASGSSFELFEYDAAGHLFTDPGMPAYNEAAASLVLQRTCAFLSGLESP